MNSTRWVTLTEFIMHLGRTGVAHVDETDKGWLIAWIDRSPKALEKQEASLKKERATMNDEQRERLLIAEQIERAEREAREKRENTSASEEEKRREEGEKKVFHSLSAKPAVASSSAVPSEGLKFTVNPLEVNLLKRPNLLKHPSAATEKANETERGRCFNRREAYPWRIRSRSTDGLWTYVRFHLDRTKFPRALPPQCHLSLPLRELRARILLRQSLQSTAGSRL